MMASEFYGGCLESSTASINPQPDLLIKPWLSNVASRVMGIRTSMSLVRAIHEVVVCFLSCCIRDMERWRFYHVHPEDEDGI